VRIDEIKSLVDGLPTCMDVPHEMRVIQELQKIPTDELVFKKKILIEIVDRIFESHLENYGFDEIDQVRLVQFAKWLRRQNETVFGGAESEMTSLADFVEASK